MFKTRLFAMLKSISRFETIQKKINSKYYKKVKVSDEKLTKYTSF